MWLFHLSGGSERKLMCHYLYGLRKRKRKYCSILLLSAGCCCLFALLKYLKEKRNNNLEKLRCGSVDQENNINNLLWNSRPSPPAGKLMFCVPSLPPAPTLSWWMVSLLLLKNVSICVGWYGVVGDLLRQYSPENGNNNHVNKRCMSILYLPIPTYHSYCLFCFASCCVW